VIVILAIVSVANVLPHRLQQILRLGLRISGTACPTRQAKIVKGLKQNDAITYTTGKAASSREGYARRYSTLSPGFRVDYIDVEKRPQEARAPRDEAGHFVRPNRNKKEKPRA